MPWKETSAMDERMKFVGRLLSGEKMAHLCKEFGISRVTGHKIWKRYQQDGSRGLYNQNSGDTILNSDRFENYLLTSANAQLVLVSQGQWRGHWVILKVHK